ncbi:MAG: DUF4013 domain-containing protein [Methanosphaera sp.]|nr:DUF4013 domain-containing protein [Methanosphaera sp.]
MVYPFQNIKAFVLYIVLGIVAAIIGGSTILDLVAAASSKGLSGYVLTGVGIVGVIVSLLILFLIEGYALDIVKFGIERRAEGPGIDFGRQVSNAIKLIVVDIVYYIVPCIIIFVLGLFLKNWILTIISLILIIVFALANFMARCRLAQTDNLAEALAIGEAIGDISRVGIGRILATVILVILVAFIIVLIVGAIYSLNDIIGSIILGLASVYIVFFYHRAIGLLYSE